MCDSSPLHFPLTPEKAGLGISLLILLSPTRLAMSEHNEFNEGI